jgi:hypothetical protein
MRQQALAHYMEKAGEGGADRVRVLHISPSGNRALHEVTAPALRRFGEDAFEVFAGLLVEPDRFIGSTVEDLFRPALSRHSEEIWARYLIERYAFWSGPA